MADADLVQYNRVAADADAANQESALTGQLLIPQDGKKITAENNAGGKAPVNRALKKLSLQIAGLRGWLVGNIVGIAARTLKSLHVDLAGGNASTALPGMVKCDTVKAFTYTEVSDGTDAATLFKDRVIIDVDTDGKLEVQDDRIVFTRTAMSDGNPAPSVSVANEVRPINQLKIGGYVETIGGTLFLRDGFGIASVALSGPSIRINFATPFDNAYYQYTEGDANAAGAATSTRLIVRNTDYCEIRFPGVDATIVDCAVGFQIAGRVST